MVLDVGADTKVRALAGGAVAGVIGLVAILSALTGQTTGSEGTAVAVGLVGLVFLGIGLLPLIAWKKVARPRRLVFDAFGVRWHQEMEHLWEFHTVENGYRLPLGSSPRHIPVIERAMRQHRPGAYLGIRDEGFTVGLV
ncbi:hypothetical protein ACFQ0B_52910 [Nonomuraea thailandensis]